MQILSHRGFWSKTIEKNSLNAFKNSFESGFGLETDLRDRDGELVVAHDLPTSKDLLFTTFKSLASKYNLFLALNIKSDGLANLVKDNMKDFPSINWMVFDMSIPDMLQHLSVGNPIYTRISEIEKHPACYEECIGIWLDAFFSEWYSTKDIEHHLKMKKKICIVSPELHNRQHLNLWLSLKENNLYKDENLMLCTDFPDKAKLYFNL